MAEIAILDVDGTPANTDYPHTEAWTRALEEVGKRVPRVDAYRRIGEGADRLIPEFVGEEAAGKVDRRHAVLSGGAFGRDELEGFRRYVRLPRLRRASGGRVPRKYPRKRIKDYAAGDL